MEQSERYGSSKVTANSPVSKKALVKSPETVGELLDYSLHVLYYLYGSKGPIWRESSKNL